jgi:hypothetical protein
MTPETRRGRRTWNCQVTMPSAAKPCTSTTAGLSFLAGGGSLLLLVVLAAAPGVTSRTVGLSLGTMSLGTQKVMTVPAPSTSTVCCRSPALRTRKCSSGFCASTRFTILARACTGRDTVSVSAAPGKPPWIILAKCWVVVREPGLTLYKTIRAARGTRQTTECCLRRMDRAGE